MSAHPDQKLLALGRQFDAALKRARRVEPKWRNARARLEGIAAERGLDAFEPKTRRELEKESGNRAAYAEFTKHHSEACRIMRAIYREKAITLEGFAIKLAVVTFDQFDFDLSPRESNCDVAEKQLLRLSRQMTAAVQRPSRLAELIAAFHEAKAGRDAAWDADDDYSSGPEQERLDAAENAIVRYPCQTLDDVRVKADFFLNNLSPYDTIRNCATADEETLLPFLRSLMGIAS